MSSAVKQAVFQSSLSRSHGVRSEGKVWGPDHGRPVLCLHSMAVNCGTFNTLIPFYPKSADMWRWTWQVTVCPPIVPLEHFIQLLHMWRTYAESTKGASQEMRQAMDEMLLFEKKTEEKQKVFTFEKAAERLLAANPTLSEQSVRILLERGLAQVEGGFVFSRDLRVHTTNIMCLSLEQALEMQSNIQARVLVILGDKGYGAASTQPDRWKLISMLLQGFRDRNHMVMTVSGDHYIHLNSPEVIAPFVFDFLQPKVLPEQQA